MDEILIKYSQLINIFDYFSVGVIIIKSDRKIVAMNRSAELITGQSASTAIGKYCHQTFNDYLCGGECKFYQILETGEELGSADLEIVDQSYEVHSITKLISPLYGHDQKLLGGIEIFQDHSAFKDLIERVRHDDRRLKIILDNLDIGVLTVDCSGHVSFFNTMAEKITGFMRKEILGKSCATLFGKDTFDDVFLLTETISDGRPRSNKEEEIITHEGQVIQIGRAHV